MQVQYVSVKRTQRSQQYPFIMIIRINGKEKKIYLYYYNGRYWAKSMSRGVNMKPLIKRANCDIARLEREKSGESLRKNNALIRQAAAFARRHPND